MCDLRTKCRTSPERSGGVLVCAGGYNQRMDAICHLMKWTWEAAKVLAPVAVPIAAVIYLFDWLSADASVLWFVVGMIVTAPLIWFIVGIIGQHSDPRYAKRPPDDP